MPNTLKATLVQNSPNIAPNKAILEVVFPPASPGTAYTAGGDYVDIAAADQLDPSLLGPVGPQNNLPAAVAVDNLTTSGEQAFWIPGTTLKNGKLQLFLANGTEFSGNYGTPWVTGAVLLEVTLSLYDQ